MAFEMMRGQNWPLNFPFLFKGQTEVVQAFVNDGYERALAGIEQEIRTIVDSEYSERMQAASFWGRWKLTRAIKVEVKRRVQEKVRATNLSPDSLY